LAFELAFELKGVEKDTRKVRYALFAISEGCTRFAESYRLRFNKGQTGYRTWNDFVEQLRIEYADPKEAEEAQRKIETLKQSEKVREYFRRVEDLNRKAGFDKKTLQRHALNGLKEDIRQAILRVPEPPSSYEALKKQAINIGVNLEHEAKKGHGDQSQSRKRSREDEKSGSNGKKPKTDHKDKPKGSSGGKSNKVESSGSAKSQNTEKKSSWAEIPEDLKKERIKSGVCIKCGKKGHRVKDCRSSINTSAKVAAAAKETSKVESQGKAAALATVIKNTSTNLELCEISSNESENDLDLYTGMDCKSFLPCQVKTKADIENRKKRKHGCDETEVVSEGSSEGFSKGFSSSLNCSVLSSGKARVSRMIIEDDFSLTESCKRTKTDEVLVFHTKSKAVSNRIIVPVRLLWAVEGNSKQRYVIKVQAMLDTGAEMSVIDPKLIQEYGIPVQPRKSITTITGANGVPIPGAGKQVVESTTMAIRDPTARGERITSPHFEVFTLDEAPIILGMD
jgi:Retrotransposon gag protein/Aspartyl protease